MAKIETPQPVRGTQSLLGEEADRFHAVISAFDRVRRLFGFRRVEVPVIEPTAVFARTIGETTDVVSKEMYTFEDRSGDSIALRPELTAGIARAFLSEGWQQHAPLKVATWGAAFRYERPQKGRFRQFHQLDAEILGTGDPSADDAALDALVTDLENYRFVIESDFITYFLNSVVVTVGAVVPAVVFSFMAAYAIVRGTSMRFLRAVNGLFLIERIVAASGINAERGR